MSSNCKCGEKIDLIAALDGLPSDQMGSSGMLVLTCNRCGQKDEVELHNGRIELGYTYWAGSMHFETVREVRVSGLTITRSDPDDLDVVIRDRHWHFGIRQISHVRFVVFQQAFAAGKRLGDLDFKQWAVAVTSVERGADRLEAAADLILAADDFLHLSGPAPALTRAWHYMNDGKPRKA